MAVDDSKRPVDLLGDPWSPPRDPRGRKRHKRLPQIAEKVAFLRASGLTVEQIEVRIGLSDDTLRKYYSRELDNAETLAKSVLLEAMLEKAKTGSAAAARFVQEHLDKGRAAVPLKPSALTAPKLEKLGKKATADLEAQTAHEDTSWGSLLN